MSMKKINSIVFTLLFLSASFHLFSQELPVQQEKNYLNLSNLKKLGRVDERYQSFNIEMCEVIGGDFWIPYDLIDSVRKTSNKTGFAALKWKIDPINLYNKKLRNLAAALGPYYLRVSGTWANAVYFQDNEEEKITNPPAGFKNILTRSQWKGVVDFSKSVNAKMVTSFPISDGIRDEKGKWTNKALKPIMDYTQSIGGEIVAAEMFNEPSHAGHGDAPKGYNAENYASDFSIFKELINKDYPQLKILGPGSTGEGGIIPSQDIFVDNLLSAFPKPTFDVFTYHFYGSVSKRCGGNQTVEKALSAEWLSKTEKGLAFYQNARDKYMPSVPIWNTETAESACGGNPLATTYVDVFRYLEQLGRLAKKDVQVVMHNTLARSEYAILDQDTYTPRPNYWAALLWNKLMGTQVFEHANFSPGVDVFVHNLKGSDSGKTALVLNTTSTETTIEIPQTGQIYILSADQLTSKNVKCNGVELKLNADDTIPVIPAKKIKKGTLKLASHSIAFITFK